MPSPSSLSVLETSHDWPSWRARYSPAAHGRTRMQTGTKMAPRSRVRLRSWGKVWGGRRPYARLHGRQIGGTRSDANNLAERGVPCLVPSTILLLRITA
ncbi:hypothetical protein AGOR_G00131180 [Albula goreensis]|uniref:Uncharacterized protein n=1 Tax=Albula goreensis TaxID=1534307 RepID=A0A8T3D7E3_9TELE|nr:hypothetical protein AGOR_G00131180 [Albula goreensis]